MSFKFCGFNGFQQFADCKHQKTVKPTDFQIPELKEDNWNNLLQFSWSFNLYSSGNFLIISGFHNGTIIQNKKIELQCEIKQICSTDRICLILLENDQLWKYEFIKDILSEVIFRTKPSPPLKRSIFGEYMNKTNSNLDSIILIGCSAAGFVAITRDNSVYALPTKIFQFPHHIKITDLCFGFEHFLILTSNGDVYSWGNGLRGQLGHDDLDSLDCPKIIDALAGIKIKCISAGGWHSAAISTFDDLYVWGNNESGQLGIQVYKTTSDDLKIKNPTVFHLPEIIDIECECKVATENNSTSFDCSVVKIKCGARHSLIQMRCGKIYGSGWNTHNQLGIEDEKKIIKGIIDQFVSINTIDYSKIDDFICGHWCSIFKLKKEK